MSDGINLGSVVIHNSPDVRGWAVTAALTKLEFRSSGVHVEHSKRYGAGAWPNFRPAGWDGDLQYTLWIFLHIGGQWHGSGCIQFWQDCDQNGGPPEEFAKNWYYAEDRWTVMTGYQPRKGEKVGFMVTAGDARNSGKVTLQERSNVVVIDFPSSGDIYTFAAEPAPAPDQTPEPVPQPVPQPVPTDNVAVWQAIESLKGSVDAMTAAVFIQVDAIKRLTAPLVPVPLVFPVYEGKAFGATVVLKPRKGDQ